MRPPVKEVMRLLLKLQTFLVGVSLKDSSRVYSMPYDSYMEGRNYDD